jgi:hypothetical protein
VVETVEWVEVVVKPSSGNATVNATSESANNETTAEGKLEEGGPEGNASAANGTEAPRTKLKQKKRTLRIPLKVRVGHCLVDLLTRRCSDQIAPCSVPSC